MVTGALARQRVIIAAHQVTTTSGRTFKLTWQNEFVKAITDPAGNLYALLVLVIVLAAALSLLRRDAE